MGAYIYSTTSPKVENCIGYVDDDGTIYQGSYKSVDKVIGCVDDYGKVYDSSAPKVEHCIGCVGDSGTLYNSSVPILGHEIGSVSDDGTIYSTNSPVVGTWIGLVKPASLYGKGAACFFVQYGFLNSSSGSSAKSADTAYSAKANATEDIYEPAPQQRSEDRRSDSGTEVIGVAGGCLEEIGEKLFIGFIAFIVIGLILFKFGDFLTTHKVIGTIVDITVFGGLGILLLKKIMPIFRSGDRNPDNTANTAATHAPAATGTKASAANNTITSSVPDKSVSTEENAQGQDGGLIAEYVVILLIVSAGWFTTKLLFTLFRVEQFSIEAPDFYIPAIIAAVACLYNHFSGKKND